MEALNEIPRWLHEKRARELQDWLQGWLGAAGIRAATSGDLRPSNAHGHLTVTFSWEDAEKLRARLLDQPPQERGQ